MVGGGIVLNGNPGPDGRAYGETWGVVRYVPQFATWILSVAIDPFAFSPPAFPVPAVNPEGQ